MNNKLEAEIVRLVYEISEDEKEIMRATKASQDSFSSDSFKQKYQSKAAMYTDSLNRKMRLLELLKGKA